MLTKLLMAQRRKAYARNLKNIISCMEKVPNAQLCDLGCDDGGWTIKLGQSVSTQNLFGIEIIEERQKQAETVGVKAVLGDLNHRLPYENDSFDIVHTNQVIEHLADIDMFLSEIFRILKPRGYVVLSTENLASWHNVVALCLGYMPFSLTNITSKTAALGNPLAPHANEEFWESSSWHHKTVFTTRGLIHLLELYGLKIAAIKGAGYYPFGNMFSAIDPFHCAFITIKALKL